MRIPSGRQMDICACTVSIFLVAITNKNPLPAQVKGFTRKNTSGAFPKNSPHFHVQPVTRGLKLPFLYNNQAGLPAYRSTHPPSSQFPSDISA